MKGKHSGRYFGFTSWMDTGHINVETMFKLTELIELFRLRLVTTWGNQLWVGCKLDMSLTMSVKGQDDEVNVTLLRPIGDITNHLRDTGELLYNREANDLVVLRSDWLSDDNDGKTKTKRSNKLLKTILGQQRIKANALEDTKRGVELKRFDWHRLRGRLLNTFCVKLNLPMISNQLEENCQTIGDFSLPQTETACQVRKPHSWL